MIIDRIKHEIKRLEHRIDMMEKRHEQIIHDIMTARRRHADDERLRLEVKIEEDKKFLKLLKELINEE